MQLVAIGHRLFRRIAYVGKSRREIIPDASDCGDCYYRSNYTKKDQRDLIVPLGKHPMLVGRSFFFANLVDYLKR